MTHCKITNQLSAQDLQGTEPIATNDKTQIVFDAFPRWTARGEDMTKVIEYFGFIQDNVSKESLIAELRKVGILMDSYIEPIQLSI